jgi:thioesterase domain-containing protein
MESLHWLDAHYAAMPPVAAMRLSPARFAGDALELNAPLASHVNDKGCAFGGSLVSLMTLAGWGLVTLRLREAGIEADVFVADTQVRYLAPLYADLQATARVAEHHAWPDAIARLRAAGRDSVPVQARVALPDGGDAARADARFVAVAR